MIAGRLNERVTLYAPATLTDEYGHVKKTYTEEQSVAAEVRWKTGNTVDDTPEIVVTTRIEVLIRDAITVEREWRLGYQNDTYHIDAVEHNRRKGFKRLFCDRVND